MTEVQTITHAAPATNERECLCADEVAALLRVNRKTVYAYAARAVIPCRRLGRRFVFSRAGLAAWLAHAPATIIPGGSR